MFLFSLLLTGFTEQRGWRVAVLKRRSSFLFSEGQIYNRTLRFANGFRSAVTHITLFFSENLTNEKKNLILTEFQLTMRQYQQRNNEKNC